MRSVVVAASLMLGGLQVTWADPGWAQGSDGRALLDQGKAAYKAGAYDKAATLFDQAYAADKSLVQALYNKAFALRKTKAYPAARDAYRAYLRAVPGDKDGLFGLAETERLLGNAGEASRLFADYIEKEDRSDKAKYVDYAKRRVAELGAAAPAKPAAPAPPAAAAPASGESVGALLERGKEEYKRKEFKKSAETFAQAAAQDPKNKEALYRRALSLRKAKDYPAAIKAYGAFRQEDPNDLDGLFGLAETYRLNGDNDLAQQLFGQYVKVEQRPDRAKYRAYAERQIAKLKDAPPTTAAAPAPAAATTGAPKVSASAIAASARRIAEGDALMKQKKYKEAAAMYAAAHDKNPTEPLALYRRALALRKAGDLAGAKAAYEAFRRERPDDIDALYGLAKTEAALGNSAAARALYQQYVAQEKRESEQKYVDKAKAWLADHGGGTAGEKTAAAPSAAPPAADKPAATEAPPPAAADKPPVKVSAQDRRRAEQLATKAKIAYGQKKFGKAADLYRDAHKLDPNRDKLLYRRALALRKAGDHEGAKGAYEAYLAAVPDDVDALYGLATTYKLLDDTDNARRYFALYADKETRPSEQRYVDKAKAYLAETAPAEGAMPSTLDVADVPPAPAAHADGSDERLARHVIEPHPEAGPQPGHVAPHARILSVDALLRDGTRALDADPAVAAEHAMLATTLEPADPRGHLLLGRAYDAQGYKKDAEAAYTRASQLGLDKDIGRAARAMITDGGPRPGRGRAKAPPVSERSQARANGLATTAQELVGQGDLAGAQETYLAALDEDPKQYDALLGLAELHMLSRSHVKAIAAYRRALAAAPDHAAPLFGLAQAFERIGNQRQALHHYKLYRQSTAEDRDPEKAQLAWRRLEGL